jgi:hypothetical protein
VSFSEEVNISSYSPSDIIYIYITKICISYLKYVAFNFFFSFITCFLFSYLPLSLYKTSYLKLNLLLNDIQFMWTNPSTAMRFSVTTPLENLQAFFATLSALPQRVVRISNTSGVTEPPRKRSNPRQYVPVRYFG